MGKPTRACTAPPRARHGRIGRATHVAVALGVTASTLLLGCGSGQQRVAVPESLCGFRVATSTVSKLLPPGNKLTTDDKDLMHSADSETCSLYVDGNTALLLITDRQETPIDIVSRAREELGGTMLSSSRGDQDFLAWNTGAIAKLDCPAPGNAEWDEKGDLLYVEVRSNSDTPADAVDRREVLAKFLRQLLPQVSAAKSCDQ